MKILMIGNSFSQDASEHLYSIAKEFDSEHRFLNLYIGGCSLEQHVNALRENKQIHCVQENSKDNFDELHTTIREGIEPCDWDYISVQQLSGLSGVYDSYHPYIDELVGYLRERCPSAKILLHRTWSYEDGSCHGAFPTYDSSVDTMHGRITECYERIREDIGAYGIIPTGDVIYNLQKQPEFNVKQGGVSLYRDTYHLGYTYGRYAAAACWLTALGICDIDKSTFLPTEAGEVKPELIELIKKTVKSTVKPI